MIARDFDRLIYYASKLRSLITVDCEETRLWDFFKKEYEEVWRKEHEEARSDTGHTPSNLG